MEFVEEPNYYQNVFIDDLGYLCQVNPHLESINHIAKIWMTKYVQAIDILNQLSKISNIRIRSLFCPRMHDTFPQTNYDFRLVDKLIVNDIHFPSWHRFQSLRHLKLMKSPCSANLKSLLENVPIESISLYDNLVGATYLLNLGRTFKKIKLFLTSIQDEKTLATSINIIFNILSKSGASQQITLAYKFRNLDHLIPLISYLSITNI
ncbi:hypothetical protein PPL_09169 [Heterostelium album PN500]|uniref:Uncharacterized protein n=1 Tax=Heterostelium pallidum (strain ATCC 26659 / Pp 5 / PN500) TaxID=670386 RepID=D3BKT7_HETP5|nr:hypothetical protein PPL_09169 [Heterostelium album PN500]EFA78517.1 hypothetical protein PPL_09169 [Heterostelium album PN500]|eukprot:XP_020430641.1 hypothetical protein PPL_09169 [Heterostelium album PN500]